MLELKKKTFAVLTDKTYAGSIKHPLYDKDASVTSIFRVARKRWV